MDLPWYLTHVLNHMPPTWKYWRRNVCIHHMEHILGLCNSPQLWSNFIKRQWTLTDMTPVEHGGITAATVCPQSHWALSSPANRYVSGIQVMISPSAASSVPPAAPSAPACSPAALTYVSPARPSCVCRWRADVQRCSQNKHARRSEVNLLLF